MSDRFRLESLIGFGWIMQLSGHLHLTGLKTRHGIAHFSHSGLASYPSHGAVVYELYADRIEATVQTIPDKWVQPVTALHGKPRHAHDFTDADHPTAEEYQCGREDERRFTIVLPEGKRPVG